VRNVTWDGGSLGLRLPRVPELPAGSTTGEPLMAESG
jgi:hypothetical protein